MVQRDAIESGYSTPARTEDASTSTDPAGGVVADDRPLVLATWRAESAPQASHGASLVEELAPTNPCQTEPPSVEDTQSRQHTQDRHAGEEMQATEDSILFCLSRASALHVDATPYVDATGSEQATDRGLMGTRWPLPYRSVSGGRSRPRPSRRNTARPVRARSPRRRATETRSGKDPRSPMSHEESTQDGQESQEDVGDRGCLRPGLRSAAGGGCRWRPGDRKAKAASQPRRQWKYKAKAAS